MSVAELEPLSFFEVEPSWADQSISWPYNLLTYQTNLGHVSVYFTIAPSYNDIVLVLRVEGVEIYRFEGLSIQDIHYHNDADAEVLEMVISDRDTIWFRLRPNVFITQKLTEF